MEQLGAIFAKPKRQASSNYGVGADGRIGLYVNECDRSWCSGSASNDNRAITIEVADEPFPPYRVPDVVMKSLIELLVDICKRNNIPKLLWKNDPKLIGQVDKQNMTLHRWFQATACPGEYLIEKHSYIAEEVNKQLIQLYSVQVGAFRKQKNAFAMERRLMAIQVFPSTTWDGGYYRVFATRFRRLNEAEDMQRFLKEKGIVSTIKKE